MQLSKYVKIFSFPSKEKPGYLLLYSTQTTSTILINESVLESIKQGSLSHTNTEILSRLGFLVSDLSEDNDRILGLFDRIDNNNKRFNAVVVMNLFCNLTCRYCYESEIEGRFHMSYKTADSLIDYIEKNPIYHENEIHLCFYGGEPLLSIKKIKYISERLKVLTEKKGLVYTFSLVTNGTLLTRKTAEELVRLGLKNAKITIDGPCENHNYFRPFKSGAGTFKVIIKNIKDVYDLINIHLGGNFTRSNYENFPQLLDYLCQEGLTPEKFSIVKFDPVVETKKEFGLPDFNSGCKSINEPWLFEASIFLREEILKKGFNTAKILPASCMVELKNDIVINFDGTIHKCPGFIGRKDLEIGNIWTGIKDYRKSHSLEFWKRQECLDCAYLPLCFGGCRYIKLLRDERINNIDCRKPYLDATLETFIKQEIKYNSKSFNKLKAFM